MPGKKLSIIHMVGSAPLDDAGSVFRKLGTKLGNYVERIPDGETGRRVRWVSFIWDQLKEHPDFEVDPTLPPFKFVQWDGKLVFEIERLRFKENVDPNTVEFNTGYAEDALRNYESFKSLKSEGVVPPQVKYQICMATPLAIAYNFISSKCYEEFITAYTRHLAEELRRITDNLSHDQISYQWDVCQEVLMWENYFDQPPNYKEQILSTLANIAKLVPTSIDLGFHLCYGSPKDEHLVQPKDMGILVEMANGICNAVSRQIDYIHMPVPKDRIDDAFFRPLANLSLKRDMALILGLIHAHSAEGNASRLATAQKYATINGVAAECGLGRGDPEAFENILEEHLRLVEKNG